MSSVHPFHNFVPIYDPTLAINDLPDDLLSHHLVACDACDVCPIVGTRYKCVDRDCPDFDLCANCEADPVPRHPRNHLILKIREPVPSAVARKKFQFVKNMMHAQAEAEKKAAAENEKGTSFGAKGQLIPGAGGDQTLVIDLDVSGLEGSEKLPSLIHVPVKLRAEGFTGPLVVSPQVVEKAKQEEKDVVPLLDEMEIAAAPAPIAKQYDATFIRDVSFFFFFSVSFGSYSLTIALTMELFASRRLRSRTALASPLARNSTKFGTFATLAPKVSGLFFQGPTIKVIQTNISI